LKSRFALDAQDVKAALAAAEEHALQRGFCVSIAIVDDGAHLLGFLRMTDASPMSAAIAQHKARTAALSRRESKHYDDSVKNGRLAFLGLPEVVALEGGVPIIADGQCIGAVGVSGVKSNEDAEVGAAGIEAIFARPLP